MLEGDGFLKSDLAQVSACVKYSPAGTRVRIGLDLVAWTVLFALTSPLALTLSLTIQVGLEFRFFR